MRQYAALGANPLILVLRTPEKGEQAKAEIIRRTQCSPDIFIIETVHLANFASVKALGGRVVTNPRVKQIHVAMLVAGVAQWQYESSVDSYVVTLEVNVLSQALLALLLQRKMRTPIAMDTPSIKNDDSVPHLSFLHSIAGFEVTAEWLPNSQSLIERCNDREK